MNLALYGDDSKGIIRLDPRTKLLIFFVSGALSLTSHHIAPLALYGMLLCVILILCGQKAFALGSYVALLVGLYLRYCIGLQGSSSGVLLTIVSALVMMALFCFPIVMSFCLITQTTRISQFMAAFQAMRLPTKVIIPIAVLFRFIPSVADEWTGIRKAMAFRGISLEPLAIVKAPLKTVEYILIPLLFSSVAVMEEMAAAALARGIDSDGQRSSYEEVKLRAADYIVIAAFLLLAICLFTWGRVGL
jgi:energy-coupling factor transport system permease protein